MLYIILNIKGFSLKGLETVKKKSVLENTGYKWDLRIESFGQPF